MKNVLSNAFGKAKYQDVFQIYNTPSAQALEHGCSFPTKLAMWTCRFRLHGWFFWAVLIYISGSPSATHLIALSATSCKGASAQSVSELLPGINSNSMHRTVGYMHPAYHAWPWYLTLDSITVHCMDSDELNTCSTGHQLSHSVVLCSDSVLRIQGNVFTPLVSNLSAFRMTSKAWCSDSSGILSGPLPRPHVCRLSPHALPLRHIGCFSLTV